MSVLILNVRRFEGGGQLGRQFFRHWLVAGCAAAALLASVASAPGESLLLKGATVHPVSSPTLSPGQVWIKDGKIAAVGQVVQADGAQVIELGGTHLYPGLVAATTSLGLTEINAVRATRDSAEVGGFTPDVRSWLAVNPDSELLPVARANGITHFVPVPEGGVVSGHSGLMVLDGWTMEDMTLRKPLALHLHWPSMDLDLTPKSRFKDASKWKSPEELVKARRLELAAIEDFFRQASVYARSREASADFPVNPPWEAMRPALQRHIPVIVHALDLREIKAAVSWAATNRLRIVIAGGRDAAPVASLLASNQVPVIFENIFNRQIRDMDSYDTQYRAPALLQQAGVLLAISVGLGDSNETEVRNLAHHAAQAVAFGLPADEAIKAITLNPAKILGVADRIGSIEVGKDATLIAMTGDLLDIRSNVRQMWIAGRSMNLESRHTRLYDKYRARPIAK
ncbi:MAG: amidohydrolase family protein [Verrucomicrobiales bacterium]|nr:amidohydrolase family protein [Verrucomicrobiales bacterium]